MNTIHGICTNIQHMSIHDGPGIRTTVFMKGCPLRCVWCHNPETLTVSPELFIYLNKCTNCGICLSVCHEGAVTVKDGSVITSHKKCISCFQCVPLCMNRARSICGTDYTVDELLHILLRDRRYYEKSGGGVTFSGGEPLLQIDFIKALTAELHHEGIHVAMETSAYGSVNAMDAAIDCVDFFMIDLKHMNDECHRRFTGVSNQRILENIIRCSEKNADVLIRIPMVEGANTDLNNLEKTVEFLLTKTKYRKVELLRMHRLAEEKYHSLGREYLLDELKEPTEEKMEEYAHILAALGLDIIYKKKVFNYREKEVKSCKGRIENVQNP